MKAFYQHLALILFFVAIVSESHGQKKWEKLMNDALKFYKEGRIEKAIQVGEEARTTGEKELGKDDSMYASISFNLSAFYSKAGDFQRAERYAQEAVEIWKKNEGTSHSMYASGLYNLAAIYQKTGQFKKAEPLYVMAREIKAKTVGVEDGEYIAILVNLVALYVDSGEFDKVRPLAFEAKEITAKKYGKTHPYYVKAVTNLGIMYLGKGDFDKALPLYMEAERINGSTLGFENPEYALSLFNLASLYLQKGNYKEAEKLALSAKQIQEKTIGKNASNYGKTLNNLALIYMSLGNFAKAEPFALEAKDVIARSLGKDHPAYASAVFNLSSIYQSMGNHAKAEPLALETVELKLRAFGKDHPDYARALVSIADAAQYAGNHNAKQVESWFMEAREIQLRTIGREHPDYAMTLNNLAAFYSMRGNIEKAEPLAIEASGIKEVTLGKRHPDYVRSLFFLGLLNERMDKYDKAEALYLENIDRQRQEINDVFPYLSDKERQAFVESNSSFFSHFETFCLENRRYEGNPPVLATWYNIKLFTKGLLLNTSNKVRNNVLNSKNKALIDDYSLWKEKRDYLVKAYQMSVAEKAENGIDEAKLEEEANVLEKKLSQQSAAFSGNVDRKQYTWEDVRRSLKPDEAAIEIIQVLKHGESMYAVLVVTAQTQKYPGLVLLEDGDDLEQKYVKYYRNSIIGKTQDTVSYKQFWRPIADKLKGYKKVYVSADGVYHQVNLNTLFNPASKKYVSDEINIQMVGSTKDLLVRRGAAKNVSEVTLFGFPNYNNQTKQESPGGEPLQLPGDLLKPDSSKRFFNGDNITELPGTRDEVMNISAALTAKKVSFKTFLYNDATEGEMKKLNNPQVLHVATHGFFLADLPKAATDDQTFMRVGTKKIADNPLFRSGLLFTGAKGAFKPATGTNAGEDGVLTAYEAANLNLDQTDLVVMSACETGLGVSANGEGVYGLQRAFQVAGAKSILMSLWKVDDTTTQKLMTSFYSYWSEGVAPADAFRRAQIKIREAYPDPYFWGAFVMVGAE